MAHLESEYLLQFGLLSRSERQFEQTGLKGPISFNSCYLKWFYLGLPETQIEYQYYRPFDFPSLFDQKVLPESLWTDKEI